MTREIFTKLLIRKDYKLIFLLGIKLKILKFVSYFRKPKTLISRKLTPLSIHVEFVKFIIATVGK